MSKNVYGTFSGTGASESRSIKVADISISGGNATVQVQRRINDKWGVIETITGDAERVVENGSEMELRLVCSAYTSGPVSYGIVAR